jgi:hypothetical protein
MAAQQRCCHFQGRVSMITPAVLTIVLASQVSALWAVPWFAWISRRELAPPAINLRVTFAAFLNLTIVRLNHPFGVGSILFKENN